MPEGDWGLDFVDADRWYAMQKDGEVVVVLHDPCFFTVDPKIDKAWVIVQKRAHRGWESCKDITKTEAETLYAIGDVPTIDLTQFHRWEEETYPTKLPPKGWWKKILNTK